jgi:hypothetical protein
VNPSKPLQRLKGTKKDLKLLLLEIEKRVLMDFLLGKNRKERGKF